MISVFETKPGSYIPEKISTITETYETLFGLMVGLSDTEFVEEAAPEVSSVLHLLTYTFIIFAMILLMNMLIGAMSDTYMKIAQIKELIHLKMKSHLVFTIEERSLSCMVKHIFVKRAFIHNDSTNNWMLQVTECTKDS